MAFPKNRHLAVLAALTLAVSACAPGSYDLSGRTLTDDQGQRYSISNGKLLVEPPNPTATAPPGATATVAPATPTVAPTVVPTAIPTVVVASCTASLQSLVNAAPSGGTLSVPPCIYREAVTITKPLTLVAQPGAEIRGSDVWSVGWTTNGARWQHAGAPTFPTSTDPCAGDHPRCNDRPMAFYDGTALTFVPTAPKSGQFSVENGNVVLADNPAKHLVEVVTRTSWVKVAASNVTIDGLTARHVSNNGNSAGVVSDGNNNFVFKNGKLLDAHSGLIYYGHGTGYQLINNELGRSGGTAGGASFAKQVLMQGNTYHDFDYAGFSLGWSSGAMKSAIVDGLVFDRNEVFNAWGPGFWCDIGCLNVTVSNNHIHDTGQSGIFIEVSRARVLNNVVWNTGANFRSWCFGGGITLSSATESEVAGNVLAWNAQGITVLSQNRDLGYNVVRNVKVHDNTVVMARGGGDSQALAWCQDFSAGTVNDPSAGNAGANNRFWLPTAEDGTQRFGWNNRGLSKLADLNAGWGGGGNSRYLSNDEKDSILTQQGAPLAP